MSAYADTDGNTWPCSAVLHVAGMKLAQDRFAANLLQNGSVAGRMYHSRNAI